MAPSTDDYSYSRSSSFSAARSPDTASPIYPERAIRPLPKSRLKSRLSPEQASTIVYPPSLPPLSPTLNFSTTSGGQSVAHTNGDHSSDDHYHQHEAALVHDHCTCSHTDGDSGDDEVEFDHPDYRYTSPAGVNGQAHHHGRDSVQRRLMEAAQFTKDGKPAHLGSTTSSADGYESFENTSNKKKRKIPLSSASNSIHQSKLSAELANMDISYTARPAGGEDHEGPAHSHGSDVTVSSHGAAGTGISGAGRGRYSRREVKDGRRPLANTPVNNAGGYAARHSSRSGIVNGKNHDLHAASTNTQTPGIISRAIRTAHEAAPLTPQKENVSLLQQNTHSSTASPKTQFTFTCESDSGNKMLEQPAADMYRERPAGNHPVQARTNTQRGPLTNGGPIHQGTQTAHAARNMSHPSQTETSRLQGGQHPSQAQQHPQPQYQQGQQGLQTTQQAANQRLPRPRRSPSKEYALAARQRKLQQQYSNYHHRPRREDMWICQFCEYEDIFGVPPVALIRAYEIKDRQERKKAAEKRRLLEKAKQRGRKGKKGAGKNNNKSQGVAPQAPVQDQAYDGAPLDGDDYFDDDDGYADDYDPVGPEGDEGDYDTGEYYPPPPPAPLSTPPDLGMAHAMNTARKASAAG